MIARIFAILSQAVLSAAAFVVSSIFSIVRKPLAARGDLSAFAQAAVADFKEKVRGNGAVILLKDGEVAFEYFHSNGRSVTSETLFQMGSLSKWVTAWGIMTLVDSGKLQLDMPVSNYITRWTLPDSDFDNDEVTARRLLSHTAGFLDRLGYDGFAPDKPVQTLEESLSQATDTMEGNTHGKVRVDVEPGSKFHYSGGGYTLLQLLIEEVSGMSFEAYMQQAVFGPLGMTSATFDAEKATSKLADFYDDRGNLAPHYKYTASAAASLYASSVDMVKYLQAHLTGLRGEDIGRGALSESTVREMRIPQSAMETTDTLGFWGLGAILYARAGKTDFMAGHIGGNRPASSTSAIIDPVSGDGVIVIATGRPEYAIDLASEWVFWHAGTPDVFMLHAAKVTSGIVRYVASLRLFLLKLSIRLWRSNERPKGRNNGP